MSIELQPDFPSAELLEAGAKAQRERLAIWRLFGPAYYEDVYRLNQWMLEMIFAEAQEEFLRNNAWARRYFS
jgi:hypothetical protein